MTVAEWQSAADPARMISWLSHQGYESSLWDFTLSCCRRVWDEVPNPVLRNVIIAAEALGKNQATWGVVDSALADAAEVLDQLEVRCSKASGAKLAQLNRELGYGRVVAAFEYQVSFDAADYISRQLQEWAEDVSAECIAQCRLLRTLVPDPSEPVFHDEDEDEDLDA